MLDFLDSTEPDHRNYLVVNCTCTTLQGGNSEIRVATLTTGPGGKSISSRFQRAEPSLQRAVLGRGDDGASVGIRGE